MRRVRQLGTTTVLDVVGGAGSGASAGPIGAAIGAAAGLIEGLIANSGCGQTCIAATQIVNQIAPQLVAVRNAYVNAPQRTPQMQSDALASFDSTWAWLTSSQGCGNPELGNAGKACISDRARGGRYSWFWVRDDIANTPPNAANPNPVTQAANALGIPTDLLIAGGLVLLGATL